MHVLTVVQRARSAGGRLAIAAGLLLALAGAPHAAPATAADGPPDGLTPSRSTCQYAQTHRTVQVRESGVREASALVASRQYPGIYWTLNDSKNAPVIFAIDEDGAPRGSFRVAGASNQDWEALQIGPDADGGFALYIGDVGDNAQLRRDPVIYRVTEPEPLPPGSPSRMGETAPAEAIRFVYPARPHNTEAMLVHPKTGEILLVTRELNGISMIYRLPLPLDGADMPMADLVDVVNVRALDPASGQVTDGAISADGQQIALRTYTSVLLFEVPGGILSDAIWAQQPTVSRLADGPKGEGLTFRLDSSDLISIGEEKSAPTWLYETTQQC
jgi:hypothetical protein